MDCGCTTARIFFRRHVEEMTCLDDFECLVEHRGGVDGDFCSHRPVGVVEGIGGCGVFYSGCVPGAEWASRGGDDQAFHALAFFTTEALIDG